MNLLSYIKILSSSLANRSVIVVARSDCVTEDEFEGASVVVSVKLVVPERLVVEGYMMRNKYWVGLVNFFEVQGLVD